MVGERKAIDGLFRNGYTPYFKIADGSVIQSKGQVGLTFCVEGERFEHVFYLGEMFSTNNIGQRLPT